MLYMVFIINQIHNFTNESKMLIFVYNSDRMMYMISMIYLFNNGENDTIAWRKTILFSAYWTMFLFDV